MSKPRGTGAWLPLMEYSVKKGISLSTLRRYIKARKIEFQIENGRYLLFDEAADADSVPTAVTNLGYGHGHSFGHGQGQGKSDATQVSRLEHDLQKAREEIAELKTLIALYEETPPSRPAQALDH